MATLVQQKTGSNSGSATVTMDASVASGNTLILTAFCNTTPSVSGGGVSWTQAVGATNVFIYYGHGADGTSSEITVTVSGRSAYAVANVSEWSGLANATPEATNQNAITGTTPATGSAALTSSTGIAIACAGFRDSSYSSGPTDSFTRMSSATILIYIIEPAYRILSSAASYSTEWTLGSTPISGTAMIAVFADGAPSGNPRRGDFFFAAV